MCTICNFLFGNGTFHGNPFVVALFTGQNDQMTLWQLVHAIQYHYKIYVIIVRLLLILQNRGTVSYNKALIIKS